MGTGIVYSSGSCGSTEASLTASCLKPPSFGPKLTSDHGGVVGIVCCPFQLLWRFSFILNLGKGTQAEKLQH